MFCDWSGQWQIILANLSYKIIPWCLQSRIVLKDIFVYVLVSNDRLSLASFFNFLIMPSNLYICQQSMWKRVLSSYVCNIDIMLWFLKIIFLHKYWNPYKKFIFCRHSFFFFLCLISIYWCQKVIFVVLEIVFSFLLDLILILEFIFCYFCTNAIFVVWFWDVLN